MALAVLASSGLVLAEEAPASPEDALAAGIEGLKARVQAILDQHGIPGASIALVTRERVLWAGGVGTADRADGRAVTDRTAFRLGSISKTFTALALQVAVEERLIDLEAPIRTSAPEIPFVNPWETTHPVRVAHVVEHTAGFDDIHFREYAKVDDPDMSLLEGLTYDPGSRVSRWKPGTHYSYCQAGPALAAYVLEKAAGVPFEDFVQARVLEPLGMSSSSYRLSDVAELMAQGYDTDGVREVAYDHITIRPSAGMSASARDMARFLRMMINRGSLDGERLLTPESIVRMETPTTTLAARAGHRFGYGLGIYGSFVRGHLFHGHNGGITGFTSTYWYSARLGVGFYFAINVIGKRVADIAVGYGYIDQFKDLLGGYLTAGLSPPEPPVPQLSEEDWDAVSGFYQELTPRLQLLRAVTRLLSIRHVYRDEGGLFMRRVIGGATRRLVPVTSRSFRFEGESAASLINVVDERGRTVGQWGPEGNNEKVSGAWVAFQLATAAGVAFLLLSAPLAALAWIPAKLSGRMRRTPLWTPLLPLLASLALLACVLAPPVISPTYGDLGEPSAFSVGMFLGTLASAALTLLALYTSYRSYRTEMSGGLRLHSTLVSLACSVAVSYLWACGLIGVRTWAA